MGAPRKECESEIYHVISRGTGRQLVFEDNEDRDFFIDLLVRYAGKASVEIYAWCLMGNHIHLLLHAPMARISECMKQLCGQYAQRFNTRHGRVGHLFQARFRSEPVADDPYLITVVSYIHYNPQRSNLASQETYRWSSYGQYIGRNGGEGICSIDLVLGVFGGVDSFVAYHRAYACEASCMDVDAMRFQTRAMQDEDAIALAKEVLGELRLSEVKALDRKIRDSAIRTLLAAGFSVRQVERLTGIGRGIVQRVSKQKADRGSEQLSHRARLM